MIQIPMFFQCYISDLLLLYSESPTPPPGATASVELPRE